MWKTLLQYGDDLWRAAKALITSNKTAIANTADDVVKAVGNSADDVAKAAALPSVGKPQGFAMADEFIATYNKTFVGTPKFAGDRVKVIGSYRNPSSDARVVTVHTPNGTTVTKQFNRDGLRYKEVFNDNMTSITSFVNGKPSHMAIVLKGPEGQISTIVQEGAKLSPVKLKGAKPLGIPEKIGSLTEYHNSGSPLYRVMKEQGMINRLGFNPGMGY